MSKNNSNFFEHKSEWAVVKDNLLGCYLKPYFNKVLHMRKKIVYVDCFAGKGKFGDGENGSPLIALDILKDIEKARNLVDVHLIEQHHYKELLNNITGYPFDNIEIIDGKFEDNIISLLKNACFKCNDPTVFLYIDPYGIKALNMDLFHKLADVFSSVELLINLNTSGFLREACRVNTTNIREPKGLIFDGLDEYDSSIINSEEQLDCIAGGNYWNEIIDKYNEGEIKWYEAEKEFSQKYKLCLQQKYEYVLDMPIRLKNGVNPKYRMVFATNHPDGCLLMADNIYIRTEYLIIQIQNRGQIPLFLTNAENEYIPDEYLKEKVKELLNNTNGKVGLNKFLADFFNEYGVICKSSHLNSILKQLECDGYIEVERYPFKGKNEKPLKFWSERKDKKLFLKIKR